jgi:putative ABC transport system ATP-binding protein
MSTAVEDVSLDLYPGKVSLLMGPSGSGKSTLLAMLGGLLPPSSGEVIALGQDLWKMSDSARHRFRLEHCGFIFQGFNLFPALSALQHLEMVLCLGKDVPVKIARERSHEMLARLDLAGKAHLRPAELSGGEKQRVAVARALIKEPTFCFADEPTGSLDWGHGRAVVELLCAAARVQKTSLVIVTHDARLLHFVDQVHDLDDGHLRQHAAEPTLPP